MHKGIPIKAHHTWRKYEQEAMAKSKKSSEEPRVTKQFILDHLDEDEIDLSMCNLSRVPVKELVSGSKLASDAVVLASVL